MILKVVRIPKKVESSKAEIVDNKTTFSFLTSITLILICLCSLHSMAQIDPGKVHFSYDANGNREHRWVTVQKITKVDSADSLHQDSIIKNRISNSDSNLQQSISLYPNPTQGLLDLKITGITDGETAEYVFVSLTGQELLRRKTGLPITKIDISNFAPGIYIVNVTLGKKVETWKIIKQ